MTAIAWHNCVGQQHIKGILSAAVANNTLAHAYLFSGMDGSGKFAAGLDLALILLCENGNNRPCMKCPACTRVLHYAHPDFRVITPVVLSKEKKQKNDDGITETGFKEISERISGRIADPYLTPQHEKVPEIPVELVRDLSHTILRGAHGKGPNVAVFDGIDSLNKESANSMLKLLEEPPAGTVLLLLTERPSAVLPTIVSRCQMLRFSWCRPEEIRAEICRRFSVQPTDPKLDAVIHTGSLGRSLFLWNNPADEVRKEADALWDLSLRKDWTGLGSAVDRLQEQGDFSMYEQLFLEFMQRIRTTFLRELGGTENVFSSDRTGTGKNLTRAAAERLLDLCERSIAAVKARANMMLVLAHFAITLTETLHDEKQQPR